MCVQKASHEANDGIFMCNTMHLHWPRR